ncbi:hypothetical protein ABT167_03680 [Streptomyces sp. NPDC001792]|uniref:hypothetical protein n=1 Tax=Streptomyces sp. NPDC001792 TaxID=3154524 RepID=UPI00332D219D
MYEIVIVTWHRLTNTGAAATDDDAMDDFLADFFGAVNGRAGGDRRHRHGRRRRHHGGARGARAPAVRLTREFLDKALCEVYPDAHDRLDLPAAPGPSHRQQQPHQVKRRQQRLVAELSALGIDTSGLAPA